jgi:hypothetical protein
VINKQVYIYVKILGETQNILLSSKQSGQTKRSIVESKKKQGKAEWKIYKMGLLGTSVVQCILHGF